MDFEGKKRSYLRITGFILMYLVFTTILYFLLLLIHKLPESWNYFSVVSITLSIVLIGKLIKLALK